MTKPAKTPVAAPQPASESPPGKPANVKPMKRIFIVDDHPVFVQGISQLLEREPDFSICGNAASGAEALTAIENLKPDVLILDISIQGSNGIEVMKSIRPLFPDLPTLFLSMYDEQIYAERALRAGGRGYIAKSAPPAQVLEAVRKVLSGGFYISEALGARFLDRFLTGRTRTGASIDQLTDRELEVFTAIGNGKGTRQIAGELNLSVKTVETHRAHIKEKLSITSSSEMVRAAVAWVNDENSRAE